MKKLLGILVLGLLWCNASLALPKCEGNVFNNEWTDCEGMFLDIKTDNEGNTVGKTYIGEFKDGKMNGKGSVTGSDGFKYVGEFKNDKMNGKGTMTWKSGGNYVGEWKDGLMEGLGTYTYGNGEKKTGIWKYSELIKEQ